MAGRKAKKQEKAGVGCLVLFSLPFAGVGVVMTWLMVSTVLAWHGMQSWDQAPAQILHAELEVHQGDDSTTYSVEARYTYEYEGQQYTGTRVAISGSADNIGSFQQDAYDELSRHRDSEQPFLCFVNPGDPSDAVLYRNLRWELLMLQSTFAIVFGGAGFGLMAVGLYSARKHRAENLLRSQNPGQPWLWREEWATGEIQSRTKALMLFVILFATMWNAIAIPISAIVVNEAVLGDGDRKGLIVLLFPAVGLLLILWAVRMVIQWRKFGRSVFRMAEVPGVLGGKLSGVIEVPVNVRPENGFHLTLNCINKRTSGSGKNRSTHESVLWQDTRVVSRELFEEDLTRSAIPVAFGVPYDGRASDSSDSDNEIIWRLEAKAAVAGVDYDAQFDVPVFMTEASSPDFVLDEAPLAEYLADSNPLDVLAASGVRITPLSSGGVRMEFPMARAKGTATGMTVFLAIWTAVIVVLVKVSAPILFPIVFGLFELLFIYFALDLWFGSSRVEARFQELEFSGGWFGSGKTRSLLFEEIERIKPVRGMQSGSKLFYSVAAKTTDGKTYTLAKRIEGLRAAETVAQTLTDALGGVSSGR
jgi:Protein of unknown function (DUF3592)